MTTIVYRDGVLAADGRLTNDDNLILTDECQKIRRLSDGALFVLAGDDTFEEQIVDWLEGDFDGALPQAEKDKEFIAILVDADGALNVYEGSGDRFVQWPDDRFAAFGSGAEVAYGALEMGADAYMAVEIACLRNTTTGGDIQIAVPGYIEPTEG